MLSDTQIQSYRNQGFMVLENQVPMAMIESIRDEIAGYYQLAAGMTQSDERIDLESTHRAAEPRIRRIKLPHTHMASCHRLMRHESILQPVRELIGPSHRHTGE